MAATLAVTLTLALPAASADGSSSGAAGVAAPSAASPSAAAVSPRVSAPEPCSAHKAVKFFRTRYVEWTEKRGAVPVLHRTRPLSCPRWQAGVLQRKARAARLAYERWFAALYEKWRCIHEHEGAWNDDDPPYWGGLQMTLWFQQTYGPEFFRRWGTADRWPVWAQLTAAERAHQSDGDYGQWGTARACGLPT